MLAFAKARGLPLACFGAVGGGWLSDAYLGAPRAPDARALGTVSLRMYRSPLTRWARGGGGDAESWALFQELLRALRAVADKRRSTIANVAVAWVLRRLDDEGAGGWVVLGVRDTKHIAEHVALRDVALDDDDMAVIAKVLAKGEPPSGDIWSHERAR